MKNFTFKTDKATGQYRSFFPDYHIIKFNKIEVGSIKDRVPYTIGLMVVKKDINEDGNTNCIWKWIRFKKEFNTLDDAKEWLNSNKEVIFKAYEIYFDKEQ